MTVVNQFDDNTTLWAAALNALANAHGAGGIVSGCSISKGTGDWDIDVTAGTVIEANTEASITADTVTLSDASGLSAGESRVDLIHADTGDVIATTEGTAASDPTSPDIPAGEVLLGFVVVSNGDSTVADSDIFDVPALRQNDNTLLKDGNSHELDAADLTGASGSDGQVLASDGSAASWSGITGSQSSPSGSRSSNTWYQNTTGNVLIVEAWGTDPGGQTVNGHSNSSQTNNIVVSHAEDAVDDRNEGVTMAVPDQNYYKVEASSITRWTEVELTP